jgi:hypothetical protein
LYKRRGLNPLLKTAFCLLPSALCLFNDEIKTQMLHPYRISGDVGKA